MLAFDEIGNKRPVKSNNSKVLIVFAQIYQAFFFSPLTSKIIRCSPKQKVDPKGLVLFGDDDLNRREGEEIGPVRTGNFLGITSS